MPTSVSLLDRLKAARPAASDWHRLQGIYPPLIRRWLARVPGLADEADDLAQEVFLAVVRELPRFARRREGSFLSWMICSPLLDLSRLATGTPIGFDG